MSAVPEWLRLQRKIFSRWVNQKLWMSRHIKVDDIITAIQNDPTVLLHLVEVLSEKTFTGKLDKNPKMRVQKISILNLILKFIYEDCGVVMKIRTSPEDCLDGDEKNVLGLVFSILMRYMRFGDEDGPQLSAKDALLMWVQNKTSSYGLTVNNFGSSFHSGMALCALIHKHRPQLINYESLDAANKLPNIKTAMDAAEKYFGLEQYITPAEFLKLDESGMMVYVSEYFYGIAEQRKIDQAARRVHKVIKFTKTCDGMRADFAAQAKEFKERLAKVEKVLGDRTIDNTMAGARRRIEEFYDYKANDKNVILSCQLNLEGLYNNLSMLLSHNKRPAFVPPEGLSLKDIESTVAHLEQAEQERKVALHAELNRQIKLVKLAERHESLFNKLSGWVADKEAFIAVNEAIESIGAANLAISSLDAIIDEHAALLAGTGAAIKKLGAELQAEKYEHYDAVAQHETALDAAFDALKQHEDAKKLVLQDALAREEFKERVRLQAKQHQQRHEKLSAWAAETQAWTEARETINSVGEAQHLLQLLEARAQDRAETAAGAVAALKRLGDEIVAAHYKTEYSDWVYEHQDEIVSRHTWADETLTALEGLHATKLEFAQAELKREQYKEELRLRFAQQAADFVRWSKEEAEDVGLSLFGWTLEEVEAYQATLATLDAETGKGKSTRRDAIAATLGEFEQYGVKENPYTTLTTADIDAADASLEAALEDRRARYAEELARQRRNDDLCKQFAAVADPLASWIISTKDTITRSTGKLHEQLEYVESRLASAAQEGAALAQVRDLQKQIDDAGVTNNRHTLLTAKDVEVQWAQYEAFLGLKKKMLEVEIENEERRGITAEQFKEIEENFKQFDVDKNGTIDQKELKACLYSLGEEMQQSEIAKILAEYGHDKVIDYNGFKNFMIHIFGDTDTKEDVISGWELISRGLPAVKEDQITMIMETEDVQYIKTTAPKKDDGYDYHAWTDDVFSR